MSTDDTAVHDDGQIPASVATDATLNALPSAVHEPTGAVAPVQNAPLGHTGRTPTETVPRDLFGNRLQSSVPQDSFLGMSQMPAAMAQGLLPEKFDGKNFKTWQNKMVFYMSNLNADKFLKEDPPIVPFGNKDAHIQAAVDAWKHHDFICRGWILGRLIDPLYKVYSQEARTSKELWMALEKKYKSDDAGSQKFVVAKFLDFKMVDSKPIMEQVDALSLICHDIAAEGMMIDEIFTVNCFIEKLPPSWLSFKNYLKHKKKPMSLSDVIMRLQMEERNRTNFATSEQHSVNMTEVKGTGKGKGKPKSLKPSSSTNFKKQGIAQKKFKGKCHNCGKQGHKSDVCRSSAKAKKSNPQANLTEEDMCAVVSEVNMVDDNPQEWWYDTGATTHICTDKNMFTTYQKNKSEEQLFMGNTAHSKIEGRGKVVLKLTSGRELTLNNVKHVPDMRKNLVSGTLLSKAGFGTSFEADKLVLRKNGVYLGKGYVKGGLVKMCVMTVLRPDKLEIAKIVINDDSMNEKTVAYLVESYNIWHERLGHVNSKSMQKLMSLNLIPKCKIDKDKCEVCVQAKLTKTPSPQVQRTTEPLCLIHTDYVISNIYKLEAVKSIL